MLVLWGGKGRSANGTTPLAIWRSYCANTVIGGPVKSGHYIAEEAPEAMLDWFAKFF